MIKEYCEASNICVIRDRHYGSGMSYLNSLCDAARESFPELSNSEISVKQYGGERIKRTFGVEFKPPTTPGDEWRRIAQLEKTI